VRSRGRHDYAVTSKRCCLVTAAEPFKTGPWESKAFSIAILYMVTALCRVHEAKCSGTAHNSATNSEPAQFEFTHRSPATPSRRDGVTPVAPTGSQAGTGSLTKSAWASGPQRRRQTPAPSTTGQVHRHGDRHTLMHPLSPSLCHRDPRKRYARPNASKVVKPVYTSSPRSAAACSTT
jgi:hypothetical protein